MKRSPIRKVFQGVADRHQMFRLFDRHARFPGRRKAEDNALYRGEWFEIAKVEHDCMFELLPPLWTRDDMFAIREFLTDSITSIFFRPVIDGHVRYFHGYCDLLDRAAPAKMRHAIIERELRSVKSMTREERIEHIWSATHDAYRGYADERFPYEERGNRIIMMCAEWQTRHFRLLDQLTDAEISAKLPIHLRCLPDAIAA